MTPENSTRRYTEQEVALVLRRAAELEDREQTAAAPSRGLSLEDIRQIAHEVGFSTDALNAAVAELHASGRLTGTAWLGAPSSTKAVRAVPRRLTESELQRLVQTVEDRAAATGTVSEALGSVRWTSVPSGFKGHHIMQVLFTPTDEETQIQITQRRAPRLPYLFHLLPGVWGGVIGLGVAASLGLAVAPAGAVVGGAVAGGMAVGRAVWHAVARRSHRRINELARELADEAERMSRPMLPPSE